jgi:omega-6 fatty acid desaturase (delta-12 desaturase)
MVSTTNVPSKQERLFWRSMVAEYQTPSKWKSVWQLLNSVMPFFLLWGLMYLSLSYSYWLTLLLALPAAGFVIRIFIIQHDCGHGSFFKSRKANDRVGSFCGVLTLVPYHYWRRHHAIHHANSGNLDHRGIGDVYTMTVDEYTNGPKWKQWGYRIYRNPFFLFTIAPTFLFVVLYRFYHPFHSKRWKKERASVLWTNIAILSLAIVMSWLVGFKEFLLIQAPITIIASTLGTWMFYLQHQYEEAYWEHTGNWEYTRAALQGSSFYKLPKVLQWFTGNIGFHHIHHLSPKIPNYNLQKCHEENPELQEVVLLTLASSLKTANLGLWDEKQQKLVSFGSLKRMPEQGTA